jgi:hypothetical protein
VIEMGFTIEDAFIQCKDQYKLTLLAGKNGCANAISWIHLIEDTTIIQQLWGKELAVTTGLGFQSDEALFEFIQKLVKYHSTGLIINVGKYIFDIPDYIIDYCNEQDFPLITIPWEIHLADVIKDFSMRCIYSEKLDSKISKYFQKAFLNPMLIETYRNDMMDYFDVDGYFQVLLINIENSDQFDSIELRRVSLQIQLYFEKINAKYNFFWFDSYFVLIINNINGDIKEIIEKMYKRVMKKMPDRHIHVGLGSQIKDISHVVKSFNRAKAALDFAIHFDEPYIDFNNMGIYKLLFSIEDKDILTDFYSRKLSVLASYDDKHHTNFEETFYYYLKYNGSIQKIASIMYTHRNTINYRITKIKQLLDNDIDTPEEKFEYMLAFYIKEMS